MQIEKINGVFVPYNLSIEQLETILSTSDMSEFIVACEALSSKPEEKALNILKNYISHKDKYKRLSVLKTIFKHPMSIELKWFLEDSILSDDILFVENGLKIAYNYKIKISEQVILSAISNHLNNIYSTTLYILKTIDVNENNYIKLLKLFNQSEKCGKKEVISEILCENYLPEKALELFEIFSRDKFSKIRLLAVKLGKEYDFDISKFSEDLDGHIKKEVIQK